MLSVIFRKVITKTFCNQKKGAAHRIEPRPEKHPHVLMAIVVVIVVIPIAIAMPPVAVLVPPAMILIPAVFSSFVQIAPRMIGLPAVPAMMLHGFMQFVIRLGDAPLAPVVIFGGSPRRSRECQHADECCCSQHRLSEKLLLSHLNLHYSLHPSIFPGWNGVGSRSIKHHRWENVARDVPYHKQMQLNNLGGIVCQ